MKLLIINGPNLNMLGIREKNIYPSIKDLEEKIKFVLFDLKLNLLPALEDEIIYGNDTKIHKLISDVLRLYGTYTRQYEMEKEKNAFDCRTYLDTDDLSEYAIVYDDAAVLNEQVKLLTSSPASSKEYQLFISNCSVLLEQFLELFEQYKEWIFEYSKSPHQDTLDLWNDSAEELKEAMESVGKDKLLLDGFSATIKAPYERKSIDSARLKKELPDIAEEFTKITGSDFDIDHLYLASFNYKKSKDGTTVSHDQFDPDSAEYH